MNAATVITTLANTGQLCSQPCVPALVLIYFLANRYMNQVDAVVWNTCACPNQPLGNNCLCPAIGLGRWSFMVQPRANNADSALTLGQTLLHNTHVTFDVENSRVGFAASSCPYPGLQVSLFSVHKCQACLQCDLCALSLHCMRVCRWLSSNGQFPLCCFCSRSLRCATDGCFGQRGDRAHSVGTTPDICKAVEGHTTYRVLFVRVTGAEQEARDSRHRAYFGLRCAWLCCCCSCC